MQRMVTSVAWRGTLLVGRSSEIWICLLHGIDTLAGGKGQALLVCLNHEVRGSVLVLYAAIPLKPFLFSVLRCPLTPHPNIDEAHVHNIDAACHHTTRM